MKNRTPADAINGDPVNQVGFRGGWSRADSSRKETEGFGGYRRESKPAHIDANVAGALQWHERYGDLWKLKIAFEKQHNR